jgi:hypothetical protein
MELFSGVGDSKSIVNAEINTTKTKKIKHDKI